MRSKIKIKMMSAVAVATAFFMGIFPMTAFAQSKPECKCETKCTQECINPDCEMCLEDISSCEGKEPEKTDETLEPLTPDGNLSLVDDYGSIEAGGKQFITVVTKKGNYFYIIIDRDDKGAETVHFLNMVDESDLLSLMDDEEAKEFADAMDTGNEETKENGIEEPKQEKEELEETESADPEKKNSSKTGLLVLLLLGTIGGIGGFLYLKTGKGKPSKTAKEDPDADYVDEEEDYLADLSDLEDLEDEEISEDYEEELDSDATDYEDDK